MSVIVADCRQRWQFCGSATCIEPVAGSVMHGQMMCLKTRFFSAASAAFHFLLFSPRALLGVECCFILLCTAWRGVLLLMCCALCVMSVHCVLCLCTVLMSVHCLAWSAALCCEDGVSVWNSAVLC